MTQRPGQPAWFVGLTAQHWFVLAAASLGWLFDAMDQRIFILARTPAVADLLGAATPAAAKAQMATYATALFVAGWATGGVVFGLLGDRWGRVRTMLATILIYSLFTGLTAVSVGIWDFSVYRFLTGLGVGGEFAAGVALVTETLPERSRPGALGFLQIMAIVGTLLGTLLSMACLAGAPALGITGWRLLFLVGILPALLLLGLRRRLKESAAWEVAAATPGLKLGDLSALFGSRTWRRRTLVGMILGFAGQLGIWGAGTWTPELIRGALAEERLKATVEPAAQARSGPAAAAADEQVVGWGLLLKDLGSCLGIYAFAVGAARFGRRPAFAVALIAAFAATIVTFHGLQGRTDVWWMMPMLGFCCWSLLGGYAIYFPELYPTHLRSTGVGLCYNVARYLTAAGILGLGQLLRLFAGLSYAMPLRPAAMVIGLVYLLGLAALPFAPETRGKPLPAGNPNAG